MINVQQSQNLSRTALKAFERISILWNLSKNQKMTLLGEMAYPTYNRYLKTSTVNLSRDTIERISYLLGIHKALHILIPDEQRANAWVKQPNKQFNGSSALDVMLNGSITDLQRIRTYLDSVRSGK